MSTAVSRKRRHAWEAYREWYRNDRLHQSLDYMSPVQYAQRVQNCVLLMA